MSKKIFYIQNLKYSRSKGLPDTIFSVLISGFTKELVRAFMFPDEILNTIQSDGAGANSYIHFVDSETKEIFLKLLTTNYKRLFHILEEEKAILVGSQ